MRIITRALVGTLITLGAVTTASAQSLPNFSGTWVMNATKSSYGQFPMPASNVMTIEQSATLIKVAQVVGTPNGDVSVNQEFSLDGKATTGTGFGGAVTLTTAKLDASGLSANTKVTMPQGEMTQTSKWVVSMDGKTLTVDQGMTSQMGELTFHVVFDRKE